MTIKTIYELGREFDIPDPYGKGYPDILNHCLSGLKLARTTKNWVEEKINAGTSRLEKNCREKIEKWEDSKNSIEVDFTTVRPGLSVNQTREKTTDGEILLSAVHIAQILILDRTILESISDTFIDCAADEYFWDGYGWVDSLCFRFRGEQLHFDCGYADGVNVNFAAGVARLPEVPNLSDRYLVFDGKKYKLEEV